jgi:hypothetical protein
MVFGTQQSLWKLVAVGTVTIALGATGCFSDHGVAIEVNLGDTQNVSRVELFIANETCAEDRPAGVNCMGIAPQGAMTQLPGQVFFRDKASEFMVDVKGAKATFQLKADQTTKLPIVIAVGFDKNMNPVGTATLRGLEIPSNSTRIVSTTLVRASSAQSPDPNAADRVMVWTNETSSDSCVMVEHLQHPEQPPDFVVPREDPDCDSLLNNKECNANAYDGSNDAGQASNPDCFGFGSSNTCLLGSHACTDLLGPTGDKCVPQSPQHDLDQVCVPGEFCTAACVGLDPSCPQALIDEVLSPVPRIECHVPTSLEGNLCQEDNSTPIDVDVFYPEDAKCGQQPLLGALQFTDLSTNSTNHSFGDVVMEIGSPNGACNFPLTSRRSTRTLSSPLIDHGVIQLQTGNRITLLPIVVRFEPGTCGTLAQFRCGLAGNTIVNDPMNDPLWICAHTL